MRTGLTKLVEAQGNVDELKKELVIKEQEMQVATEAAEKVLDIVMAASETANKIKEEATLVKDKAENLVELISADQQEAEKKLIAAKPALDAAEAALLVNLLAVAIFCLVLICRLLKPQILQQLGNWANHRILSHL